MNKVGIHCSNKMHRDLHRMVLLGGSHLTLLDGQRNLEVQMPGEPRRRLLDVWRERYPDGVILLRVYTPDWTTLDPEQWAAHCVTIYDEVKHWTRHLTFANEQNLPQEAPSHASHHPPQYFWSKEWYQWIAAWNERVIDALRAARPEMIIHWPAFAPGHSEDQDDNGDGTIGFEICRRAIEKCDVLDVHCYWHNADELYNQWEWFGGRFVRAHRIFPSLPIFISECGGFQGQSPALADQMTYYLGRLYDYDYVIGATPFIWDSGPEHDINRWWGNERLIQAVTAMPKPSAPMPVKPLPSPNQLPTYPFEYHYVLLGQTPEGIVPWSWIEAMKDYIRTFRVTLGFSHDHAMMSSERTPVRHVTIIGSPDAEVPVSLEVEEMIRASGALVNRVMGRTADEIKAELDRRVREGKPYG